MVFRIDPNRYQPLYTPLAILSGCLLIAVVIYTSGGITITIGGREAVEETESPTVAGEAEVQTEYDQAALDCFAECLTEKGAKLYTLSTCPACKDQKDPFGNSLRYLNHIECDNESSGGGQACTQAEITHVPTWIFEDGSKLVGVQTLEALSEKTDCPLK